ncbi:unnamed protein product [Mytilus coruscus]|uniref:Uncharacterized protein n=1 Tax=Mytilus coruscus TaxID=42192 RepID=A0A6J8EWT9_MYTCO|nr:unnamed protein product [Mytilus coruscus]
MFYEDQNVAFSMIKDGHNLLDSGQAGAGKTSLVKKAVKYLRKHQRKAEIVCYTGIDATYFSDLRAQAVHLSVGIEDDSIDDITTESDDDHDDHDDSPQPDTSVFVNTYADFSDSEIEHLGFLDSLIADHISTEGQTSSPSKLAVDIVLNGFIGTPLELDILLFKQLILCKYEHYNDWFELQSSLNENTGLNCFPEGDLKYSAMS